MEWSPLCHRVNVFIASAVAAAVSEINTLKNGIGLY